MNWFQLFTQLISAIILAVVTAVVTVRLALRRFYSEKWWERKAGAYAAIMQSMHHVREHADTHLAFETKAQIPMQPEDQEKLKRELQEAMADLRKHRDIGSFVISDEATALLNALFKELEASARIGHERSYFEYLDYRVGALDSALAEMRRIARKDLALTPRGLRHDWEDFVRYLGFQDRMESSSTEHTDRGAQ
jgi:hypothetical protein